MVHSNPGHIIFIYVMFEPLLRRGRFSDSTDSVWLSVRECVVAHIQSFAMDQLVRYLLPL